MRSTRLASIIGAALTVAAVSLPFASAAQASTVGTVGTAGTAAVAGTAAAVATARTSARPTVAVYDCANRPQVRPGNFGLSCDSSDLLGHLRWTSWTLSEASATGVEYINNCEPNCASGHFQADDVVVVLWRSVRVPHHAGRYAYTRITLLYPHPRRGQAQTWTTVPPGLY